MSNKNIRTAALLVIIIMFILIVKHANAANTRPSYEPTNKEWKLLYDNKVGKFYAQNEPDLKHDDFTTVWMKLVYTDDYKNNIVKSNRGFDRFSYTETAYSISCSSNKTYLSHINWYDINNKFIAEDKINPPDILDDALGRALLKEYCSQ